ncbi:MAG: T9SS type A sorting domain-containing protein [Armatimonadota bacterium]|nr:T9SS type A sorting domain-containing protein [Armatimonadota bacterium]
MKALLAAFIFLSATPAFSATMLERMYDLYVSTQTPEGWKEHLREEMLAMTRRRQRPPSGPTSTAGSMGVAGVGRAGAAARNRNMKAQGFLTPGAVAAVSLRDGTGVTFPVGALHHDALISVAATTESSDSIPVHRRIEQGLAAASLPVAFEPEGTVFNSAVTITLPYDLVLLQARALAQDDLQIHYWNPRLNVWEPLHSRVDTAARTVSAEVRHFSVYQVLGAGGGIGVAAAETALGFKAAYVFPNPVRGQNTVTIRVQPGQADSVEVRIYDLSGRRVHAPSSFNNLGAFDDGNGLGPQFTYDHVWDVSGVGSGVYTYAVTAKKAGQADIVKSGKLAVVK